MTQQWKLVPVEPTPKMIDATWNDSVDRDGGIESQNTRNRRIYAAMVNAAPTPPASAQPERDWELSCFYCNGSGHVFVKRQVAELATDVQEFKEDCEGCDGRGFNIAFEDIPGIEAYVKSRRPASASAKDDAKDEKFIQAAVDHATEPLRRLGEYLSRVLDEDQWAIAESMILGACNNAPTNERSMYEAWERTRAGYPFARQFANLMWEAWQARAALASAPVAHLADWRIDTSAGGPILVYKNCSVIEGEQAQYVLRLVAADQASAPVADAAPEYAYSDDGKTVTMTNADRAPSYRASAPVAGEAQLAQARLIHGDLRGKWFDIDLSGEYHDYFVENPGYEVRILYAAPQASEAVRDQALAALQSAQRFIRNGIEFGYVRMPDADTPDPAHRTPGLIEAAIRALSSQRGAQKEKSDAG